jgi:hypothetical protein
MQSPLDLSDDELQAVFGSLSPTESTFTQQTTTPDLAIGQFTSDHGLTQFGASDYLQ